MTRVRLTLGLMGLDELNLRVLSSASDDETEKKNANKVCECLIVALAYLFCKYRSCSCFMVAVTGYWS